MNKKYLCSFALLFFVFVSLTCESPIKRTVDKKLLGSYSFEYNTNYKIIIDEQFFVIGDMAFYYNCTKNEYDMNIVRLYYDNELKKECPEIIVLADPFLLVVTIFSEEGRSDWHFYADSTF